MTQSPTTPGGLLQFAERPREHVVRVRLACLMAALADSSPASVSGGDPRSGSPKPGPLTSDGRVPGFGSALGEGVIALPGRRLPDGGLGCLVVAPRGLVLVDFVPRYHCAPAVRDILRRAHALRSWLEDTLLAGLPVLVAVCTKEHSSPANSPPLLLDRLWLGALDQLSEWLATGEVIDRSACQGVATFLAGELPPD